MKNICTQKMTIYVRHAPKAYANNKNSLNGYAFDPPLTDEGVFLAELQFRNMCEKYDIPQIIICSPFLRTRQTAKIAKHVIYQSTGKKIPIETNSFLGEYLGNISDLSYFEEKVHPDTLNCNPIGKETWAEFVQRVRNYVKHVDYSGYDENVWIITHGIVICAIAMEYGMEIDAPQELKGFSFKNNTITLL